MQVIIRLNPSAKKEGGEFGIGEADTKVHAKGTFSGSYSMFYLLCMKIEYTTVIMVKHALIDCFSNCAVRCV